MSLQDRIPNGLKGGTATRSPGAPNQQIICSVNHRIIQCPFALPHRLLYIRHVVRREVEDRSRRTLLLVLRQVQKRYDRVL
jgi:uncharacterized protein YicC (UPF0701 family)